MECAPLVKQCSEDGETDCEAIETFPAISIGQISSNLVKDGVTLGGIAGVVEGESHSNCVQDGEVGCIATASFKAVDMTNVAAGSIKSGVTIAGVAGEYPSAAYPLSGATATADLDSSTFDAQMISAAGFEYWTSVGGREVGNGDSDIAEANLQHGTDIFGVVGTEVDASEHCTSDGQVDCITTAQYLAADTQGFSGWDIRSGKTIAGIGGEIIFHKNMANTILFDRTAGTAAQNGVDLYDTVDDFNAGGAFPSEAPLGWTQATGANFVMDSVNDSGAGGGTAGNGQCDGTEACIYVDKFTNLMWARADGTNYLWEDAITRCDDLSYGGYDDWRLATFKEMVQASIDGIYSLKAATKLSISSSFYHTATTSSQDPANTVAQGLVNGNVNMAVKASATWRAICVR
jgi:hypothetical protein